MSIKRSSLEKRNNVTPPTIGQMLVLPIVGGVTLNSFGILKNMNTESTCSFNIFYVIKLDPAYF